MSLPGLGPVVVFMAGLPETPEVLIEANSFAERFDYLGSSSFSVVVGVHAARLDVV